MTVIPVVPGMTTANVIFGSLGAVTRRNPFRFAERYQVECDVEKRVEMLRLIYPGYTALFDPKPKDKEKDVYARKMVDVFFLSDKCRKNGGDHNFQDTWYQMEHFVNHQCQEKEVLPHVLKRLPNLGSLDGERITGDVTRRCTSKCGRHEKVMEKLDLSALPECHVRRRILLGCVG